MAIYVIEATLGKYRDAHGGGVSYPVQADGEPLSPGLDEVVSWRESGTRLVVHLSTTKANAQAIVDANPDRDAALVDPADQNLFDFIWSSARARRDEELEKLLWMDQRHRQQLDLVAAGKLTAADLTAEAHLELLECIQALRDVTKAAHPGAVEWPDTSAFLEGGAA